MNLLAFRAAFVKVFKWAFQGAGRYIQGGACIKKKICAKSKPPLRAACSACGKTQKADQMRRRGAGLRPQACFKAQPPLRAVLGAEITQEGISAPFQS